MEYFPKKHCNNRHQKVSFLEICNNAKAKSGSGCLQRLRFTLGLLSVTMLMRLPTEKYMCACVRADVCMCARASNAIVRCD